LGFAVWWLHAGLWFLSDHESGAVGIPLIAVLVAGTAGWKGWCSGAKLEWVYCGLAVMVMGFRAVPKTIELGSGIPAGLLAMIVGLAFFAVGTAVATRRAGSPAVRPRPGFEGNNS
jgi:hypothetical protein